MVREVCGALLLFRVTSSLRTWFTRLQQIIHHCTFQRFLERGCNVDWIGDFMDRIMLSKPEILRLLCNIIVSRLVAYLLNMICLILQLLYKILCIYEFSYKFDTVFYQFLETGTSDRCRISNIQRLIFSGVILYHFLKVFSPIISFKLYFFTLNS